MRPSWVAAGTALTLRGMRRCSLACAAGRTGSGRSGAAAVSAGARVFAAGQGRGTDAADAHSVALAATGMMGLHLVTGDARLEVLRVLAGRRRALGEDRTRMICRLRRLLPELIPGGAKRSLSAARRRVARS